MKAITLTFVIIGAAATTASFMRRVEWLEGRA